MIKVAIVDDHKLFREGIRFLLSQMKGIDVVFEVASGNDLLEQLPDYQVDIVLLDLEMDDMDGVDTIQQLKPDYPDLGIIVLTMHSETKMMAYLMELGANSYLLKDTEPEVLRRLYIWEKKRAFISHLPFLTLC